MLPFSSEAAAGLVAVNIRLPLASHRVLGLAHRDARLIVGRRRALAHIGLATPDAFDTAYSPERVDHAQQVTLNGSGQRGNRNVTTSRPPHPCGPESGLSAQYRMPPPILIGWPPTLMSLETVALSGVDHCLCVQS